MGLIILIIGSICYLCKLNKQCLAQFFDLKEVKLLCNIPCTIIKLVKVTYECCRCEYYDIVTITTYSDETVTKETTCTSIICLIWNILCLMMKIMATFFTIISYYIFLGFFLLIWKISQIIYLKCQNEGNENGDNLPNDNKGNQFIGGIPINVGRRNEQYVDNINNIQAINNAHRQINSNTNINIQHQKTNINNNSNNHFPQNFYNNNALPQGNNNNYYNEQYNNHYNNYNYNVKINNNINEQNLNHYNNYNSNINNNINEQNNDHYNNYNENNNNYNNDNNIQIHNNYENNNNEGPPPNANLGNNENHDKNNESQPFENDIEFNRIEY